MQHNPYYDERSVATSVACGRHREAVGGLWDELGKLQLAFLRSQGLQPMHRLLDVGCGAFRLGARAVDYLRPGNYFGIDVSASLIEAGFTRELTPEQRERLPRDNVRVTADFDLPESLREIDIAIAQSLFTHLPLNQIRRCLMRVVEKLRPGGVFFATAWLVPDDWPLDKPFQQPGAIDGEPILSHDCQDPYHYRFADFAHLARELPCQVRLIGDWGHPRGQLMLVFERS